MKLLPVVLAFCLALTYADDNADENADLTDSDLFEGDMILDPEQRLAVEFGIDTRGSSAKRLWPNGIVHYTISQDLIFNPNAMEAIEAAMTTWSSQTCIRFIPRTNEEAYIEFFGSGTGCWSSLGRTGKKQQISLGQGCRRMGTIAHEIAHALGFYHEQSRPDRDDYVTINFENIQEKKAGNFKKMSASIIDTMGTPYDYGSVMHYGEKYFSKNKLPTIVPKKAGVSIGQRAGPSPMDVLQMNLLYKCGGDNTFGWCRDKYPVYCQNNRRYCHWQSHMKGKCDKTCNFC